MTSQSIAKSQAMIQQSEKEVKQICKKEVEGELQIKDLDIFKTIFWNQAIPVKKLDALIDIKRKQKSKEHTNNIEAPKNFNYFSKVL